MQIMSRAIVGVFVLIAACLSGCVPPTVRAYSGPELAENELGRMRTENVSIELIDRHPLADFGVTEPIADDAKPLFFLKPGVHAITLTTRDSARRGNYIEFLESVNAPTISVTIEAGHRYVAKANGYVTGYLARVYDEDTGLPVSKEIELKAPADAMQPVRAGFARIIGMGLFSTSNGAVSSATGRQIRLFAKNAESEAWMKKVIVSQRGESWNAITQTTVLDEKPAAITKTERAELGYGLGEFCFNDVSPGTYYILFANRRPPVAYGVVTVTAGQDLRDIMLTTDGLRKKGDKMPEPLPPFHPEMPTWFRILSGGPIIQTGD